MAAIGFMLCLILIGLMLLWLVIAFRNRNAIKNWLRFNIPYYAKDAEKELDAPDDEA